METENKIEETKDQPNNLRFNQDDNLEFCDYLKKLVIKNPGKGNDSIRMYGIRELIRKRIFINRKKLASILRIKYKTVNNWLYNKHDTGIPIEKALEIYSKFGADPSELFYSRKYFGCTNSRKYELPSYLTAELSYLLGYIIGDGHLSNPEDFIGNGSRYNSEIRITTSDKSHLEYLRLIFQNSFNYSPNIYKEKNFYRLIGRSKVIHRFLSEVCEIPTGNKKRKTLIPKLIERNIKLEKAFISGFFDSDGTLYIDRKGRKFIRIKQYNKKILEECQRVFTDLNIYSAIYRDNGFRKGKKTRAFVIAIQRQDDVERFIRKFQSFKIAEVLERTKIK